jgi:hypothetical protein
MIDINQQEQIECLRPYYVPGILYKGRNTSFYDLSTIIDGQQISIKNMKKKPSFLGFNQVIQGAVLRFKRLFGEDSDVGVIIHNSPSPRRFHLKFELVSRKKIRLCGEDYLVSVMSEYTYDKMDKVRYYPIVYRQTCSNGQVAFVTKDFREEIDVKQVYEVGCEWTSCALESYQRKLNNYFVQQKNNQVNDLNDFVNEVNSLSNKIFGDDVVGNEFQEMDRVTEMLDNDNSPEQIASDNFSSIGANKYAAWNTLTEIASHQSDSKSRTDAFLKLGRYLSNQLEKDFASNRKNNFEDMFWSELVEFSKN